MSTHFEATVGVATVELPPGVEHYETSCFAPTWELYDSLAEEDGWTEERSRHELSGHAWKRAEIRGNNIVVHEPTAPRPVEQVARDILAESMTPIVTPGEDEAFAERGWRESQT